MGRFVRLLAFSYLIGNGDLHGKNVSIQALPGSGRVQLTPSYDLLSTLPYGDQKMALKLEGRDDHIKRAHFVAFARRHGVPERACAAVLDELVEESPAWIARLEEIGLPERKTRQLRLLMEKRRGELVES
jgi:serine/threonine-protein kinase HipA